MDYKNTLNILSTNFEMKGNLNVKEPIIQKKWYEQEIYQKILSKNKHCKKWTLHDGPPYANGNIHVGHAINKIIKDVIVRYRNMINCYSEYIPGWDTHGLPIEHALMVSGENKDPKLSINQRRTNCHKFAQKFVELQKTQFQRLGLLTNFQKIYCTYDHDFESRQLELLLNAINQRLIYRDLKPVYWSWSSQSALADAEVEYREIKSPSVYISFIVAKGNNFLKENDKLIIWTTTPWTLPSNLAIAVNPKLIYIRVQVGNSIYVISKSRLEAISKILKWENYNILNEALGNDLENTIYAHPFYDRKSPIILASYVSNDDGTGLVHNAPGFGEDDYLACKKYQIEPFSPIDNYGKFTKAVNDPDLINIFYENANDIIVEKCKKNNTLLHIEFILHTAAHDWRTKKPVIYRATKQWFLNVSKIKNELLVALDNVQFKCEQNRKQIVDMIKNRAEWCISRQRVWGVPIPIIFDEHDEPIFDFEQLNHTLEILIREGTNVWFEKPLDYFLIEKIKLNPRSKKYRKETDTMDVWFDSGTSFLLLEPSGLDFPSDLYFEGSDQYRGWFNSSLINGVIQHKKAPYKMLLSHGMTLDEQGRKMSKSLGNVVDPLIVCEKYGADILRLWATNTNFEEDQRISDNILKQIAESYRRIRNTLFRFCLANLADFDYTQNANFDFDEASCFILNQLKKNIKKINVHYANYDFNEIVKLINTHTNELSTWYFDLIKDTLYCEGKNNPKRRYIQTTLYLILKSYLLLLSPILPHTCEEAYQHFNIPNKLESIHLENLPNELNIQLKEIDINKWVFFFKIKDLVFLNLEKLRQEKIINKNNQAMVTLTFNNTYHFNENELKYYLNVAKVQIINADKENIDIKVTNANLIKCERCWNYYEPSQINNENICNRCSDVLKNH